jgi:hypothetical protein
VRPLDLLTWAWDILRFVQTPSQHRRQDLCGIEECFFFCPAFGEGVWQVYELNQERAILLGFNGCGVSNIHGSTSLQLYAGLALYRCEKTSADIAGTMHWNRYSLAAFREDVVATANAVERPACGLQLRDDFIARHAADDRSFVI